MSNSRIISPDLVKAYRNAHYFVHHGQEVLLLKVGAINHALSALMKSYGAQSAAFLTAYNPYSQIQSQAQNEAAHAQLLGRLEGCHIESIEGLGVDPSSSWDGEVSVLALGINVSQAEQLAHEFGQNAYVWIANTEGFVNLKLCYSIGDPSTEELSNWLSQLPEDLRGAASCLTNEERNWLMTVSESEQHHWLSPSTWDWNAPWPIARPDGCPIALGTEMDRMFKLTSNGLEKFYS